MPAEFLVCIINMTDGAVYVAIPCNPPENYQCLVEKNEDAPMSDEAYGVCIDEKSGKVFYAGKVFLTKKA
jgi:hypothetical protein